MNTRIYKKVELKMIFHVYNLSVALVYMAENIIKVELEIYKISNNLNSCLTRVVH